MRNGGKRENAELKFHALHIAHSTDRIWSVSLQKQPLMPGLEPMKPHHTDDDKKDEEDLQPT
jgi:hypothetical protein